MTSGRPLTRKTTSNRFSTAPTWYVHWLQTVEPIVRRVVSVDESHGDVLAVRAKRHRLLAAQPGHELLVGPDETVGLHGEDAGAQLVDDFVGAVGLGGDLGVEPDERLAYPRLHHHVAVLARELNGPAT